MGLVYKAILERLDRGNIRSYFLFETLVLKLLGEYLRTTGKSLEPGRALEDDRRVEIDGIAPDGVDALPGPTLIEIKLSTHVAALFHKLDKLTVLATRADCKSVLFIYGHEFRDRDELRLRTKWEEIASSIELQLWDATKLTELVEQHSDLVDSLLKELTTLRLRSVVEHAPTDWKAEREHLLSELSKSYSTGDLTLFLGAGISIDAGLPDWPNLLDSLFVQFLTRDLSASDIRDDEIEAIVKRLRDVDDPSPLMTARYLRRGIVEDATEETTQFQEAVTKELYRKSSSRSNTSELLTTLAHMTHPRRSGAKISGVVSYNFDDLFEKELDRTGDLYRSIFREGDAASIDELPIYHVHGFLPESRSNYDGLQDSTLAFSEEGYHEIYTDSYHWSNLVQLNLLRDSTCLFVGLSLTDPNLRRLLEIAARRTTGRTHFALMKRMDDASFTHQNGKKIVQSRKKSVQQFLDNHHRVKEELFRELGVSLVWFESYSDLPKLLRRIET